MENAFTNQNKKLKFRVWNKAFNEWVPKSQKCSEYSFVQYNNTFSLFGVSPECLEIQQFTGLKDKNGNEIYEGDIVKVKRCSVRPCIKNNQIDYEFLEGEIEIGKVFWADVFLCWQISYEHFSYDDTEDMAFNSHRYEIIGNIFENPELLKK